MKFVGLFLAQRKLPSGATVSFARAIPTDHFFDRFFKNAKTPCDINSFFA
jgi:hypothetical protein